MSSIFVRAAGVAVASVVASFVIVLTLVPALGGVVEGNAFLMTLICPLVISYPASAYFFLQKERQAETLQELRATHEELAEAYAQLADAHARLSVKARHDEMTGLLNRSAFFTALRSMRRRPGAGALLIIDADHFKQVNDTHGHHKGDEALRLIARAIAGALRSCDLVGRIGGEEFAVFVHDAGEKEAMEVAERIRCAVQAIRFLPRENEPAALSVSIGATLLRPHASWTDMMREADRHLYEAKRHGRNLVVFEGDVRVAA